MRDGNNADLTNIDLFPFIASRFGILRLSAWLVYDKTSRVGESILHIQEAIAAFPTHCSSDGGPQHSDVRIRDLG